MGPRSWVALAAIAAAAVILLFSPRETHTDFEEEPGRAARQETIKQTPSNPDTVPQR